MRFYSPYEASERILDSGRPVVAGEYFDLTKTEVETPYNSRLIAEGQVLPASDAADKAAKLASARHEKNVRGDVQPIQEPVEDDNNDQEGGDS